MAAETTRVKDIPTTATTAAADDYVLLDGATNGTRKGLASNLITATAAAAVAGHDAERIAHIPSLSSGLVGAWDASSVVISDGKIAQFTDISGLGNHLSQSVDAARWVQSSGTAVPPVFNGAGYDLTKAITLDKKGYTLAVFYGRPSDNDHQFGIQSLFPDAFIYTSKVMQLHGEERYFPGPASDEVNSYIIASGNDSLEVTRNGISGRYGVMPPGSITINKLFAQANGTVSLKLPVIAAYIFCRKLLSHEVDQLNAAHGVSVSSRTIVNYLGDSIMSGYNADYVEDCYASLAARACGATCVNASGPGFTTGNMLTEPSAGAQQTQGAKNVYVYGLGTNDLCTNLGVATVKANITTYIAALRTAVGTAARIVICTILPRTGSFYGGQTDAQNELDRLEVNKWIAANYIAIGANAVADLGAHVVMGLHATTSDATYYVDGVHPTTLGHGLLAPVVASAIGIP